MEHDALPARIAAEIASMIVAGDLPSDAKLNTQSLAERFAVSRTPVRAALTLLEAQGLVLQRPNRGYFVKPLTARSRSAALKTANGNPVGPRVYYALAEDWLRDAVPEEVTETALLQRYRVSRTELTAALSRGASEGWIERKPGYGWRLLPVAKTAEAQEQLYRMRLLLEPAGFLEPTFVLDQAVFARLRETLERVRDGAHKEWPADRLHGIGVAFHEELSRMSGNPFLHQALVRVNRMRRLLEYRSMIDRARVLAETVEHLEILDPLARGDLVETSFRMRRHVMRALERKRPSQARFGLVHNENQ
jgi:DNA-binding GntR family transcriptional regulator